MVKFTYLCIILLKNGYQTKTISKLFSENERNIFLNEIVYSLKISEPNNITVLLMTI